MGDGERLPVPYSAANDAKAAVSGLEEELGILGTNRGADRESFLMSWAGPARDTWEEEYTYSQADIFAFIDELQVFRAAIAKVIEEIEEHNSKIPAFPIADPFDPGRSQNPFSEQGLIE